VAKGIGTGTALLLTGLGAWVIWKASSAEAAGPSLVDASGRVTAVIPGVTVEADGGMPIAQAGESSESLADRHEAWGLTTGNVYMTMLEGYGAGAMDAWYAQPVYGDYVQLPYSGYG
jgi:hypothetical protein